MKKKFSAFTGQWSTETLDQFNAQFEWSC